MLHYPHEFGATLHITRYRLAAAVAASRGNFSISIRISNFDFRKLHFAKAVDELFFGQISATIDGRKREESGELGRRRWS